MKDGVCHGERLLIDGADYWRCAWDGTLAAGAAPPACPCCGRRALPNGDGRTTDCGASYSERVYEHPLYGARRMRVRG